MPITGVSIVAEENQAAKSRGRRTTHCSGGEVSGGSVRTRRKCMERPKIDFVPKGLYVDLEEVYSKYFQQVVTLST